MLRTLLLLIFIAGIAFLAYAMWESRDNTRSLQERGRADVEAARSRSRALQDQIDQQQRRAGN